MRHNNKVKNLSKPKAHRDAMIANQCKTLFENGKLKTTAPKAKVVKSFAQKLLSEIDKREGMDLERFVEKALGAVKLNEDVMNDLKKATNKKLRIFKLENRKGDNAKMALLVLEVESKKSDKKSKTK